MAISFGAVVQRLPRHRDRVLAVAHLVGVRAEAGWFRAAEVKDMFESLRLPPPGNVHESLTRMAREELLVRHSGGRLWSLTPVGEEVVADLVGDVDPTAVEVELLRSGTATLDRVEHPLIPPELAPLSFRRAVRGILEVSPFERNVFLMTRFPPAGEERHPLAAAIATIREVLASHGLILHLASDRQADDQVLGNVAAHMWASKYGLALLETVDAPATGELNDNVLIEVGAMLMTGRRCGLLKDRNAPVLPTDFVAQIYKEVDLTSGDDVGDATTGWLRDDLRLA